MAGLNKSLDINMLMRVPVQPSSSNKRTWPSAAARPARGRRATEVALLQLPTCERVYKFRRVGIQSAAKSGVPYQRLSADSGAPYQRLSADNGAPYQRLSANSGVPYQRLSANNGVPYQRLSADNGAPYQRLSANNGAPYQRLSANNGAPYQRLSADNGAPYQGGGDEGDRQRGGVQQEAAAAGDEGCAHTALVTPSALELNNRSVNTTTPHKRLYLWNSPIRSDTHSLRGADMMLEA
eukprot:1195101-Prorocentrum_minimum.AAC.8